RAGTRCRPRTLDAADDTRAPTVERDDERELTRSADSSEISMAAQGATEQGQYRGEGLGDDSLSLPLRHWYLHKSWRAARRQHADVGGTPKSHTRRWNTADVERRGNCQCDNIRELTLCGSPGLYSTTVYPPVTTLQPLSLWRARGAGPLSSVIHRSVA